MARIGVVDDDPVLRRLLCELVISDGHEVESAGCLMTALEMISENRGRIDALVTDLQLDTKGTGIEGLSVLEAAKMHGINKLAVCSGTLHDIHDDPRATGVHLIQKPAVVLPFKAWLADLLEDQLEIAV